MSSEPLTYHGTPFEDLSREEQEQALEEHAQNHYAQITAGGEPIGGVKRRERITVMSGTVVDFATGFLDVGSGVSKRYDAKGPFRVSASRHAVMVHRAEVKTDEHAQLLQLALAEAWGEHERLKNAW